MRTAAGMVGLAMAWSAVLILGQNATRPAFEVASIKAAPQLTPDLIRSGQLRAGINVRGTRADFGFMSLADLLTYAYRVKPYQISGPDWIREARWEIVAKLPDGESPDRAPEMLQTLLAERFKVAVHRENREHPVYELVVAKGGPKLQPSEPEDPAPNAASKDEGIAVPGILPGLGQNSAAGNVRMNMDGRGIVVTGSPNGTMRIAQGPNGMRLEMSKVTMAALADMLSPYTDRTVIDGTQLQGNYQVTLNLPREALLGMVQNVAIRNGLGGLLNGAIGARGANPFGGAGAGPLGAGPADPPGNSIGEAVQELGLRLEARRAPIETIVVDHAAKTPTEN